MQMPLIDNKINQNKQEIMNLDEEIEQLKPEIQGQEREIERMKKTFLNHVHDFFLDKISTKILAVFCTLAI